MSLASRIEALATRIGQEVKNRVPVTRSVLAGTGLSGGGDLTANRTLSLSAASQTSLAKADTAVQPVSGQTITEWYGTQAQFDALSTSVKNTAGAIFNIY